MAECSSMNNLPEKMLWLDLETDGLGRNRKILEIGAAVTDRKLNILDTFHRVLHLSKEDAKILEPWPLDVHTKNGLLAECAMANYTIYGAATDMITWLGKYFTELVPTGGHNVYTDIEWLRDWAPSLANKLHYRTLDISTLRYLTGSHHDVASVHRSLPDVLRDIDELRNYFHGALPSWSTIG